MPSSYTICIAACNLKEFPSLGPPHHILIFIFSESIFRLRWDNNPIVVLWFFHTIASHWYFIIWVKLNMHIGVVMTFLLAMTKYTTQAERVYCGWPFQSSVPSGMVFMQAEACHHWVPGVRKQRMMTDTQVAFSSLLILGPYPRLGLIYLYQLNKSRNFPLDIP